MGKDRMKRGCRILYIFITLAVFPVNLNAGETVRINDTFSHDLVVRLFPAEHRFSAKDTITVPETHQREFHFLIHGGLKPVSLTQGVVISRETGEQGKNRPESYRVMLPAGQRSFALEYQGSVYHPLEAYGKEEARGFSQTPGIISEEGVYLAGSSFWYPVFDDGLMTFKLQVLLPPQWDAVSQGERTRHIKKEDGTSVSWESPEPQEEIVSYECPNCGKPVSETDTKCPHCGVMFS